METTAIWDGTALQFEGVKPPVGARVNVSWTDDARQRESEAEAPAMALLRLADELNKQFPPDPDWPRDFAAQHDHYLHGQPKRAENEPPSS